MAYCKYCGSETISKATFCQKCGKKINNQNGFSFLFLKVFFWVKLRIGIIIGIGFAALMIYALLLPSNNCNLPIKYSVGNIDSRFNISDTEAVKVIQDSINEWNKGLEQEVLEYDPQSPYKINFVYDERQAQLDKIRSQTTNLQYSGDSIDAIRTSLEGQISSYESDLDQYNSDVDYWNSYGGAPSYEYYRLQNENDSLESRRNSINNLANLFDYKVDAHNSNLQNLKNELEQNKDKVETEGIYIIDSKIINIYTFGDKKDLKLILMHELGHATGVNHAQDSKSIMYYLMDSQDLDNLHLTQEDIGLVKKYCNLK